MIVASGNTLEALCGCWLVHRLIGRDMELSHPEAAFRFAGTIVLSGLVAASIGTVALALGGVLPRETGSSIGSRGGRATWPG